MSSKRALVFVASGLMLLPVQGGTAQTNAPPAEPVRAGPAIITHDDQGNVIITLAEGTEKTIGLQSAPLMPVCVKPQVTAYGRVVDPLPLATLVAEIATAQAAVVASESELKRLRVLAEQNNASARALQTAEAAAARDRGQAEAARLRLGGTWGAAVANQKDLGAFSQSLVSLSNALVQVNVPAGQKLLKPPETARITIASAEQPIEARLVGLAPFVDPQLQTQGFLYLVSTNTFGLAPGGAVVASLSLPGEAREGFLVPRTAVVRHNGAGWVYVPSSPHRYKRVQVGLDFPWNDGWFEAQALAPGETVVTIGAQLLLSEELKGGAEE